MAEGSVTARRPRLAVLLGDPNGIGPEIAVKLLARPRNLEAADVVLYTDAAMLAHGERITGLVIPTNEWSAAAPRSTPGKVSLARLELIASDAIEPGAATLAGGRAALGALEAAAHAAARGDVDGIVFAPLNKHALRLAGLVHEDELRYLQALFGVEGFVSEFNITGDLWTSRVTSHIALSEVAAAISAQGVIAAVRIVHRYRGAQSARRRRRLARTRGDRHHRAGGRASRGSGNRRAGAVAGGHGVRRRAPRRFRRRRVDVSRPGPGL